MNVNIMLGTYGNTYGYPGDEAVRAEQTDIAADVVEVNALR